MYPIGPDLNADRAYFFLRKEHPSMSNSQHVKTIKGREFITFEGLLALAHQDELNLIQTELLQHPGPDNAQTAIAHAKVRTARGTFTGVGDASPDNVRQHILPHLIRMAETRAIVRALRWATNTGKAAIEELGETSTDAPAHPSDEQVARLDTLLRDANLSDEDRRTVEEALPHLTHATASDMIAILEAKQQALADHGNGHAEAPASPQDDEPLATAKQVALIRSTLTEHGELLTDDEAQHIQRLLSDRLSKQQASDCLDYLLGKSVKNPVTSAWEKVSQGLIAERKSQRRTA